jgi:CHAT domain-containing protein
VPLSIAEITRAFQNGHSTILNYVTGRDSSIVFTINAAGKASATVLSVGTKQIIGQINSLLASLAQHDNSAENALSDRLLHSLYSSLLPESVRSQLPTNPDDQLIIIPDGILENVPFAALLDNQNKYLVANHTLSLSPSLVALLDNPPRYTDSPSFLFVTGSADTSEQKESTAQVKEIAQRLPPSAVNYLIGTEANIRNLQEQANGKGAVQLAGDVEMTANGMDAVLPLKSKDEQSQAKVSDLFATTLSCDTFVINGGSKKKVEDLDRNIMQPITTIACTLRYAGARHDVISIWSSDNKEELADFYKEQLSGLKPAAALRKAELSQISRNNHPSTWASLQIFAPLY